MISNLSSLSRRALALFLALLFCGLSPALSEETETTAVPGLSFSLKLSLDLSGVSPLQRDRLRGYADFLDSMTFEGTCFSGPEKNQIDLSLNIIPADSSASPLQLHLYGPESYRMLSSPVLGTRPLLLYTDSLLAFAAKAHEHMGLNLQYPALLIPDVYAYAFRVINYSWEDNILPSRDSHKVSAEQIRTFTKDLETSLTDASDPAAAMIDVLEICSDYDETLNAEIMNLPRYLRENVCGDSGIRIKITDDSETWTCGKKTLYEMKKTASGETAVLSLPDTDTGFYPHYTLQTRVDGDRLNADLSLGWLSRNPDKKQDLFSLKVSGTNLPARWPVETESDFSVSLTGTLFPQVLLEGSLSSRADGRVSVTIKSPAGSALAEGAVFKAEGAVLAESFGARACTQEEIDACMDIFRMNDVTLSGWLREALPSVARILPGFLIGVPATTFQSVMDDLQDSGLLSMLLSVD